MTRFVFAFPVLIVTAMSSLSCSSDDPNSPDVSDEIQALGLSLSPQASGEQAVPVAERLWEQISGTADYKNWPLLQGSSVQQDSDAPHGDFATIRFSGPNAESPVSGDILVKELWVEEENQPQALTVMLKLDGFDPDNSNWFYAKYQLDGTLATTPTGMPLAGAMEPAPGAACRGCHRDAPGNDFQWL